MIRRYEPSTIASRIKRIQETHSADIDKSIKESLVLDESSIQALCSSDIGISIMKERFLGIGTVEVKDSSLVDCVKQQIMLGYSVLVVNPGSYLEPCEGYGIYETRTQEAQLCQSSTLYNVELAFKDKYYNANKKSYNKDLYKSNILYCSNIRFLRENTCSTLGIADVITVPPPNAVTARIAEVTEADIIRALGERLSYAYQCGAIQQVDVLIVGAYGCYEYGNSPENVAAILNILSRQYKSYFKKIIHPVEGKEFDIFNSIIISSDVHNQCYNAEVM